MRAGSIGILGWFGPYVASTFSPEPAERVSGWRRNGRDAPKLKLARTVHEKTPALSLREGPGFLKTDELV
ncbi:hypothetical protein [Neomoorella thermoacetica]|uniref:hypothetical protein n=1 Tax=Neomoorella thermoacetica TaxID=1525 RepID=UPI00084CE467|nr:hypothetical protein [Moorella thermoacetica]